MRTSGTRRPALPRARFVLERLLALGCLSALLVGAGRPVTTATIALGSESISVPLGDRAWQPAARTETAASVMVEWVPVGESSGGWTELLGAEAFDKGRSKFPPPEAAMAELRGVMGRRCPETVWRVLERRGDGVLYESRTPRCGEHGPQHQIARIFDGKKNRFRVAYTTRAPEMASDIRTAWIKRFAELRPTTSE